MNNTVAFVEHFGNGEIEFNQSVVTRIRLHVVDYAAAAERGICDSERASDYNYDPNSYPVHVRECLNVLSSSADAQVISRCDQDEENRKSYAQKCIDRAGLSLFNRRVLSALINVPAGKVITYKELAAAAGNSNASRAAGSACAKNPFPIVVPCHRVVPTSGKLVGNFSAADGIASKRALLAAEGVDTSRLSEFMIDHRQIL